MTCLLLWLPTDLAPDLVKPYKVNDKTLNQAFELKHGKSVKTFNMDKVSNAPFVDVRLPYWDLHELRT